MFHEKSANWIYVNILDTIFRTKSRNFLSIIFTLLWSYVPYTTVDSFIVVPSPIHEIDIQKLIEN